MSINGTSKRFFRWVFRRDAENVFRGMAVLASGSVAAKMIGLATLPLITRLYTPADFGLMAVFAALLHIITPLITLRYILAIPLPRRDGMAMNLFALSALLIVWIGSTMALFMWAFATPLLSLIGMPELAVWWWLIVLGCVGGASYELLTYWAIRRRAYRIIAHTGVTQRFWASLVKISLGAASFGAVGLLIGQVVSMSGGVIGITRAMWEEFTQSWRQVRLRRIAQVAARYASFPIYRVPSQFLMAFAKQLPLIGFAYLYEPAVAGALSLAMTTLILPISLIGTAMGKALYAEASNLRLSDRSKIYNMTKEVQVRLFLLAVGPAILLNLFGPQLFSLVFGNEWELAGQFASLLAIATVFQFTSAPIIQLMNIFSNQSIFLTINICRASLVGSLFYISEFMMFKSGELIFYYALMMSFFYLLVTLYVMFVIRRGSFE